MRNIQEVKSLQLFPRHLCSLKKLSFSSGFALDFRFCFVLALFWDWGEGGVVVSLKVEKFIGKRNGEKEKLLRDRRSTHWVCKESTFQRKFCSVQNYEESITWV